MLAARNAPNKFPIAFPLCCDPNLWIAIKLLHYCHYALQKSGKAAVMPI